MLQKQFDIKTKIEALLKIGDGAAILQGLEDAEGRRAEARVNSAADKSIKNGYSPQKELKPDNERQNLDGHNADERQNSRNEALQIEELSLDSQGDKTKSSKTSMFSRTSSVTRVLDLELKELQTRQEKLRREAEEIEIAGLQEELARKARIAEKKIERAQVSSNCGSSFRSIPQVGAPDENLTKVSGWMNKTQEAEKVAPPINVPSVYQQTSVTTPVITVRSTHGEQCSAQMRDLKPSVQSTISTEAVVQDSGRNRTKTVIGAVSQKATAQPEMKFAILKQSMTLMAGQS